MRKLSTYTLFLFDNAQNDQKYQPYIWIVQVHVQDFLRPFQAVQEGVTVQVKFAGTFGYIHPQFQIRLKGLREVCSLLGIVATQLAETLRQ